MAKLDALNADLAATASSIGSSMRSASARRIAIIEETLAATGARGRVKR